MSNPVYVYIGSYPNEQAAQADFDVVKTLYADDVLRTYDAAVVVKDPDGKVHVRRHEESTKHAAWAGAAVGALVGLLFPPAMVAGAAVGAAAGGVVGATAAGLVAHLWRGLSRGDLKELGEALDDGEASLVVISTSELDREFAKDLKAENHLLKKLDRVEAKELELKLKALSD